MTKLVLISICLILFFTCHIKTIYSDGYGIFEFCENGTKHCIHCAQMGFSHGRYFQVPDSEKYIDEVISVVNNFRSEYARSHNISNMRFAAWNNDFFRFISSTTSDIGNANFICVTGNELIRYPTQFNHELVDFNTSMRIKMNKNSTDPIGFQAQHQKLMKKALRSEVLTEYNVDEFACEYSFIPFKRHADFLLRCIFYINPDYSEGPIISSNLCSNCSRGESCEATNYPGLCGIRLSGV